MTSFYDICKTGNIDEVLRIIMKENFNYWDLNWGLTGACLNGHIEIVNLMIKYGADDWNGGLTSACSGGYIEIVKLMIDKNAADESTNWNGGLAYACHGGHREIINLMIKYGADDFNKAMYYTCHGRLSYTKDRKEIILFLIEKGADIDQCKMELDFDDIYYLFQKGVKDFGKYQELYEQCKAVNFLFFNTVIELFNLDVAKLLVSF